MFTICWLKFPPLVAVCGWIFLSCLVAATFIDQTLLTHDKVWVGAGSPSHLATLTPAELVRLTHAEAGDLVERFPEAGGVSGARPG